MNRGGKSIPADEIASELDGVIEDLYYAANLLEQIQRRTLANETAAAAQLVADVRKKLMQR